MGLGCLFFQMQKILTTLHGFNQKEAPTVVVIARKNLIGTILDPRHHLDIVADETWDVTLDDGRVALEHAFIHDISVVGL